ncbi:UNVERIFIED_CONTAM: hypothetical protein K2H54_058198 [Gekko kuhli]
MTRADGDRRQSREGRWPRQTRHCHGASRWWQRGGHPPPQGPLAHPIPTVLTHLLSRAALARLLKEAAVKLLEVVAGLFKQAVAARALPHVMEATPTGHSDAKRPCRSDSMEGLQALSGGKNMLLPPPPLWLLSRLLPGWAGTGWYHAEITPHLPGGIVVVGFFFQQLTMHELDTLAGGNILKLQEDFKFH